MWRRISIPSLAKLSTKKYTFLAKNFTFFQTNNWFFPANKFSLLRRIYHEEKTKHNRAFHLEDNNLLRIRAAVSIVDLFCLIRRVLCGEKVWHSGFFSLIIVQFSLSRTQRGKWPLGDEKNHLKLGYLSMRFFYSVVIFGVLRLVPSVMIRCFVIIKIIL